MLLMSSVNTPIDNNRSHLLALRVCVLCELGLRVMGPSPSPNPASKEQVEEFVFVSPYLLRVPTLLAYHPTRLRLSEYCESKNVELECGRQQFVLLLFPVPV